jgi:hypothetical protein
VGVRPARVATTAEARLPGWTWAVMVRTRRPSSQATTALAASEAIPCPCHGTPMTQATSATLPPPMTVACTVPTARRSASRRTIQLCHAWVPSAERPSTSRA